MSANSEVLVSVRNLKKYFPINRGILVQRQVGAVKAIDGVSFDIYRNEILGLVGESGCGKSTTGRCILQLHRPTSGDVLLEEKNLVDLDGADLHAMRRRCQMIFQDPYASLNPRMTVSSIVSEPIENFHLLQSRNEINDRVIELLDMVGLHADYVNRYPHEFSGGQRQRIGVARALASNPEFIVCDEPISALDVSIQAQVINLLYELQQQLGLTYLFISHDLSMVRYISDRVAVMYLGKIVELACCDGIYDDAKHPYSKALLSGVPIPDPVIERTRQQIILEGDVPSPVNPPSGCRFHTRCPEVMDICRKVDPEFRDLGDEHFCACHLYNND
jgi:oligopeptide transport system ATP-binding protein